MLIPPQRLPSGDDPAVSGRARFPRPRGRNAGRGRIVGEVSALLLATLLLAAPPQATPHLGVVRAQLACEPLPSFPFARFPRAFHAGAPVHAALDPVRFPELVGGTYPLFVVAHQSRREWRADARLVDLRGAAQAITVRPGSLADNTFLIDAGTLPAATGDDLGIDYDVVIDVNANGALDFGDVLDGWERPGFTVMRDTTQPGPHAVDEVLYSGGNFKGQNLFYPSDIGSLGLLPIVMVSHGNGHDYKWYDHIGRHLASWGYIVVSHENNTQPGVGQAAKTTIDNTDYFIKNHGTIAGGVLNGHVDVKTIVWIGHSRGGEGVVRAYQRAVTGNYVPKQFVPDDVKLLVAMAPVTFLAGSLSTPDDVPFWLIYGASDTDVTGAPGVTSGQPFALYERATGPRYCTYIQGVGHAWFHNKSGNCWCTGPALLNRASTHKILLGYLLPLLEHHLEGNEAALDFFQRSYEDFHPLGINPAAIVATEFRDPVAAGNHVIDDFQTSPSLTQSSSGYAVTTNASNLFEGLLQDPDGVLTHDDNQAVNGMTRVSDPSFDTARGVVLEWSAGTSAYYELELDPAERDLSDDEALSLRVCQQTRHPNTNQLDAGLTFSVTLRDSLGRTSTIDVASHGSATRPYPRGQSGVGKGWANEFNGFRVRLADFALDGAALDLTDVVAVRLEFGLGFGSEPGRIGLDDIQITRR